jgi:hypothetical protein
MARAVSTDVMSKLRFSRVGMSQGSGWCCEVDKQLLKSLIATSMNLLMIPIYAVLEQLTLITVTMYPVALQATLAIVVTNRSRLQSLTAE